MSENQKPLCFQVTPKLLPQWVAFGCRRGVAIVRGVGHFFMRCVKLAPRSGNSIKNPPQTLAAARGLSLFFAPLLYQTPPKNSDDSMLSRIALRRLQKHIVSNCYTTPGRDHAFSQKISHRPCVVHFYTRPWKTAPRSGNSSKNGQHALGCVQGVSLFFTTLLCETSKNACDDGMRC